MLVRLICFIRDHQWVIEKMVDPGSPKVSTYRFCIRCGAWSIKEAASALEEGLSLGQDD